MVPALFNSMTQIVSRMPPHSSTVATQPTHIEWIEDGLPRSARWCSENAIPPPRRVVIADDRMTADSAFRLASEGSALLWRGDFQNARQLLQAMARRIDRKPLKAAPLPRDQFNLYRQARSQRARTLGMLLLSFDARHELSLRRAPDVKAACIAAYGDASEPYIASLRELLGVIGAYQWRQSGIEIAALGARIHAHYGVFAPVRSEYLTLVSQAPLPSHSLAFDIGTGTGVLAALLARRGVQRVVGTDLDPRAVACARENITRLGLQNRVEIVATDLFPNGRAPLIVCNPPWLPGRPATALEHAIYDQDSRMLRAFLQGLSAHLTEGGEGWLILSDLAEHLGLREHHEIADMIEAAGLRLINRTEVRPLHPGARDISDPLHAARRAEMTSLWRLGVRENLPVAGTAA